MPQRGTSGSSDRTRRRDSRRARARRGQLTLALPGVQRAKAGALAAEGPRTPRSRALEMNADVVGRLAETLPRTSASRGSRIERGRVARVVFPPEEVAAGQGDRVRAAQRSRACRCRASSRAELHRFVVERGDQRERRRRRSGAGWQRTRSSPGSTAPGSSRATRTSSRRPGRVLDLYAGPLGGQAARPRRLRDLRRREALDPGASAHPPERSAGARRRRPTGRARVRADGRRSATSPPGTCAAARLIGRCEPKGGIEPFDRLVGR